MTTVLQSVAIAGAGAMGAMYAAHFADAGFDVVLTASGARAGRVVELGVRHDVPTPVNHAILRILRHGHPRP